MIDPQRNHTLFGSVWSSIRRGNPARTRTLKANANSTSPHLNNLSPIPYNGLSSDSLADGLNHIAKSVSQAIKASSDRGLDGGSLYDQENIPMRPLLFNGRKISSTNPPLYE